MILITPPYNLHGNLLMETSVPLTTQGQKLDALCRIKYIKYKATVCLTY